MPHTMTHVVMPWLAQAIEDGRQPEPLPDGNNRTDLRCPRLYRASGSGVDNSYAGYHPGDFADNASYVAEFRCHERDHRTSTRCADEICDEHRRHLPRAAGRLAAQVRNDRDAGGLAERDRVAISVERGVQDVAGDAQVEQEYATEDRHRQHVVTRPQQREPGPAGNQPR